MAFASCLLLIVDNKSIEIYQILNGINPPIIYGLEFQVWRYVKDKTNTLIFSY